jgi:hypothetical protein
VTQLQFITLVILLVAVVAEAQVEEIKFKLLEDLAVEAEETVTFLLEFLELQILVAVVAPTVTVVQPVLMAVQAL